jgi:uncharacterized protein YegL
MSDIIFLLDESKSMTSNAVYYINCVNKLIETQNIHNPNANFTLIKFSSYVTTLCVDSKVHTLPKFTSDMYNPNGSTALYDAIGHAIDIKDNENVVNPVIIVITDGYDNISKKYDLNTISEKISFMQKKGWIFVYIASYKDAEKIGSRLGIKTFLKYKETQQSIAEVAHACSIAIGHASFKWSGIYNKYCNINMPTDVSQLMESFVNVSI